MNKLFRYFLKLGSTGFGGPIALLGMMEDHFVNETKEVTDHEFHQYVSAAKLFPGPLATLVAIRIGYQLQGRTGGIVAGLCLLLPAFFMIIVLAYFFGGSQSQRNTWVGQIFTGLNLGGLALSMLAAIRFARPLISSNTILYFVGTGILTFFYPQHEIFFLLGCGVSSLVFHRFKNTIFDAGGSLLFLLFFESFKASLLTFGSGIAIVPVLKAVYIDQYHWVSNNDFLTALSFGQMTPGPLTILNAYLANQIAAFPGAVVATTGTFLPTFIFGIYLMPAFEKRLLVAPALKVFFEGMLPAVGGAIIGSVLRLILFAVQNDQGDFLWKNILSLIFLIAIGLKIKMHPIAIILVGAVLSLGISCL